MKRSRTPRKTYSADGMMLNVASSLIRDFQDSHKDYQFCDNLLRAINSGEIAGIREAVPAIDMDADNDCLFKERYQVHSIFKRYRFRKDIYTDLELEEAAIASFRATQDRLAALDLYQLPAKTQLVLDLAAKYISQVLGKYDDAEHRDLCRFGRRASVGIPARSASEAARWELPISGSQAQISWFDSEMSQILQVQEYWANQKRRDPNRSTYCETSALRLALVPKTFKSLRSIMPNTTIGSYMSFGLGEMMRKRLKRVGYDIRTLQMRHRYLARQSSINGLLVTADLSSASDSISVDLVNRLFPADWLVVLHQSRIGRVVLPDNSCVESLTFCTMGIGYTFPLQTLIFLALLKAIQAVYFDRLDRRTISVYGDDMIYSSRMHSYVLEHFERLGFLVNVDKTYARGSFRESCGGDYYRGRDVRPFQPRNGSAHVGPRAYEAMLYKYTNGLLVRWSEHEIGRTLRYLTSEIERVTGVCKLVPCDFPDDSGIKCPTLDFWDFLKSAKVSKPKHVGHGVYRFSFLRLTPDERKETRHEPFMWLGLRGGSLPDFYVSGKTVLLESLGPRSRAISLVCGIRDVISPLVIREMRPIQTFRSEAGCRLRRTMTFVTVSHTGRYTRQSGLSCFEDRRERT